MATATDSRGSGTASATNRATVGVVLVLGLLVVFAFVSGGTSARVGPATVDLPAGRTAVDLPLDESETTAVRVPSIGIDTRQLTELGQREDRSLETPTDAATVGHYSGGAAPGERGPAVYASHVNYRGVPGGFANLADVEGGDQVLIERADGATVVYTVDRVEQVSKDAFPTARVYGPTVGPELRLITCGGEFDSSVRSYEDNVVVFARVTEAYRA